MKALTRTDFNFEGQQSVYHGKVRDVYNINDDLMVMVATDRISAFDVILPKGIPFKGQVLNQIAARFLDATSDICPNWKLATPDPMVTVGLKCEGFRVEMIIRGILTGSAWRDYKNGCREICGVKLPEGMKENQRFPEPIITPTTKADEGHDLNISREEIIAQGIVSAEDYAVMEDYTRRLFARGQEIAAKQGLILVDTKYEFGKRDGKVYLIDEIHTPDSSRYSYADGYEEKFEKGEPLSRARYHEEGEPHPRPNERPPQQAERRARHLGHLQRHPRGGERHQGRQRARTTRHADVRLPHQEVHRRLRSSHGRHRHPRLHRRCGRAPVGCPLEQHPGPRVPQPCRSE